MSASVSTTQLAYDDRGSGVPVLLLPGLTFDRTAWSPIIERLGGGVRTIAIDLPAHGESGGRPCSVWEAAALVHELVRELGLERPVVVGHSMAGAIALSYGAAYPVLGVVSVDQPLDVRPFAQLVRRLEPALRGPGFEAAFKPFEQSIGLELVPEPLRSRVMASRHIRPELVLGYWAELLQSDPDELQQRIDQTARQIKDPYLAVFGRELEPGQRDHLEACIAAVQIEEWPGSGHCVHLVEADRFTTQLLAFIECCANDHTGVSTAAAPSRP